MYTNFLDFIFPTKNRWHLIEPTFQSFLKQTNQNFNLLIVDNSDMAEQEILAQRLIAKSVSYTHLTLPTILLV